MTHAMHTLPHRAFRPRPLFTTLATVILLTAGSLTGCSALPHGSDEMTETARTKQAAGMFEVTLTPQGLQDESQGTTLGRMSIDKTFQGDLQATSKGTMLTGRTSTKGSAGYVAIERVIGILHGRRGSFVLQHSAMMSRGVPHLTLEIVPDSGSDELKGISGSMTINIVDGQHFYELSYALQEID